MSKKKSNKKPDDRVRNWTFCVYPQSAPEDWREVLSKHQVPWVESPLHDMDADPNSGEIIKPHWHIALLFSGKKSYEQVKIMTDEVKACFPEPIKEIRGMVRYFAHLDQPKKHRYELSGIKAHNGAKIDNYIKSTTAEKHVVFGEIIDFVIAEKVVHFIDLVEYAKIHKPHDWYPTICTNTIFVREVVKSMWQKMGGGAKW